MQKKNFVAVFDDPNPAYDEHHNQDKGLVFRKTAIDTEEEDRDMKPEFSNTINVSI